MTPNEKAFLDMIAWSEIGPELLARSDNGYNVLVGSTSAHPILFDSYADHPRVYNEKFNSTAAGRYQILKRVYKSYKSRLALPDFGHDSQDIIAFRLIKECHALDLINSGDIVGAITRCSLRWASLPGNTYGQHVNSIDKLVAAYHSAGGSLPAK